jgi:hypothetical protein
MTRAIVFWATTPAEIVIAERNSAIAKKLHPALEVMVRPSLSPENGDSLPFDQVLLLSFESHVAAPLDEAFELLDRFDVCAVQYCTEVDKSQPDIPWTFLPYDPGVLAFRCSEGTQALFSGWREALEAGLSPGQALRRAVWECTEARVTTLPPEFGVHLSRATELMRAGSIIRGDGDLASVAAQLNNRLEQRGYLPGFPVLRQYNDYQLAEIASLFFTLIAIVPRKILIRQGHHE